MANATEQAKYAKKALEVKAKLSAKGHDASFGNDSPPNNGHESTGPYVELGTASVFPIKSISDFSSDVRQDDRFYMASSETAIDTCNKMKVGDSTLTVVHAEPFAPDDTTVIFYEVQARG